jgi:hypothetical protein
MSQATPRTARARKGRKIDAQEAALLSTRRGEPVISGMTDGETFHLIVEPPLPARKAAASRAETPSLFRDVEPLADPAPGPRVTGRDELAEAGLPYRFALGCSSSSGDDR